MAVLKKIKFGNSSNSIQFTEVKPASGGVITATPAHTDLADENNPEYVIDLTIANDETLVKENGALKVGTVPAAQVSVDNSDAGITATTAQAAFKELKQEIDAVDGAAKSYTIVKETTGLDTNVKEQYKLQQTIGEENTFVGEPIKIYKDSSLKSVALNGQNLDFTYILSDGTESTVSVDVSTFLAESEFKDGLAVNANGEVSAKLGQGLEFGGETGDENQSIKVKIDSTSESFLTVGANGIKISGVQDAINAAIAALDFTDTAVAGQYVSKVDEADGVISVSRANVADAVLTGYTKGNAPAAGSEAVAATDDVKGAIAKLEHQVDAAKAAASAAHSVVKQATSTGNEHVTVTASQPDANGAVTYTIGESNIASASDLTAEVTRAQSAETAIDSAIGLTKAASGEGRTYTNTGEYIGKEQTNTVASDIAALDTQVKENADDIAALETKVGGIEYEVNGTELIFYGIPLKTSNAPTPEPEEP